MSELINKNDTRATIRWKLLTGASAMVLAATIASAGNAQADESSNPMFWIELGGQMEMPRGLSGPFTAPFMYNQADSGVFTPVSPLSVQREPRFSFGEEGKLSFQPENSDWIFSAAIRYGRSNANRFVHQQTEVPLSGGGKGGRHFATGQMNYAEFRDRQSDNHLVLDFQVGKDVGLGLLGNSTINGGVRMARFSSSATASMRMRPDITITNVAHQSFLKYHYHWHHYSLSGSAERSFHGIGPSISWSGSTPLAGNLDAGELAFDWGANAALLFGKQRARVHHHTTGYFWVQGVHKSPFSIETSPSRSRSVTVPNVGADFAIAYHFQAAKVEFGYRADFYMNAMDTGIDTRNSSNVLFHGPYATISIGLGD